MRNFDLLLLRKSPSPDVPNNQEHFRARQCATRLTEVLNTEFNTVQQMPFNLRIGSDTVRAFTLCCSR